MMVFKAIQVVLWHSSGKSSIVLKALVWNVKRLTLTTAKKLFGQQQDIFISGSGLDSFVKSERMYQSHSSTMS